MMTIYVYDNEKLGDNGDQFADALIDQHDGETSTECEAWFADKYDINDYSTSYTGPSS